MQLKCKLNTFSHDGLKLGLNTRKHLESIVHNLSEMSHHFLSHVGYRLVIS